LTDQSIEARNGLESTDHMTTVATEQDRLHLRRALELAEGGRGRVSPNPLVGAVLARDGEPIGEGFHAQLGEPHAEVEAIEDCRRRGDDPAGATLYVTLEPCAHQGRQPPCTEAILAAGISRVVIGSEDPTDKASGRGPGILRDEGVEVEWASGPEASAARLLNQAFRKHARTGRPLVTYKAAMSLDGKVAVRGGESRWISGESSRALVHRWRAESDGVAVGIGTVLADDPLLTARPEGPPPNRQPARVVFDSDARLPLGSKLVATAAEAPLLVVTGGAAPSGRVEALTEAGAEVLTASGARSEDRVRAALTDLGRRGLGSLFLEGGPTLAGAFMAAGEVDELRIFIAPLLIGGEAAPGPIAGFGAAAIGDAERPLAVEHDQVGEDLLIRARLREW
jgi:diaminohydroxyphosphoribosylaminopyrimidine deaminase / 5-amino-6-(5-phosphoribosylamino)uracil reductase